MKTILLTRKEADDVQWALDCMFDFWCTQDGAWDREGNVYHECQLPRLDGRTLMLSEADEINSDLMYRVCEQLPIMAEQASELSAHQKTAAYLRCDGLREKLESAGVKPESVA